MPDGEFRSLSSRSLPYTPIRSVSTNSNWSSQSVTYSDNSRSTNSTASRRTPPKTWRSLTRGFRGVSIPGSAFGRQYISPRRLLSILVCGTLAFLLLASITEKHSNISDVHALTKYKPIRPVLRPANKHRPDPIRWLEENSDNRYAVPKRIIPQLPAFGASRRPKAALISLVRNSELKGILQSMQQLEYRWNRKYQVGMIGEMAWVHG
ncbi:Nucleotide-diphospho-sugar transferase [Diplocarpon rosae]|nr:Nucleotide-diphospho-sugar transferase [Diplocarpon rosae]